jgi:hypothetical protein
VKHESIGINQEADQGLPDRPAQGPLVRYQQEKSANEAAAGIVHGTY